MPVGRTRRWWQSRRFIQVLLVTVFLQADRRITGTLPAVTGPHSATNEYESTLCHGIAPGSGLPRPPSSFSPSDCRYRFSPRFPCSQSAESSAIVRSVFAPYCGFFAYLSEYAYLSRAYLLKNLEACVECFKSGCRTLYNYFKTLPCPTTKTSHRSCSSLLKRK